tara:strand:+ start:255 stop:623 length:369 start_codon:yes stop_codon:yes gene_type:complete
MKIRIRGNSVRYRLTKNEVEQLCREKFIVEETNFSNLDFSYAIKVSHSKNLEVNFANNQILLQIPEKLLQGWDTNNKVGFSHSVTTSNNKVIDLLLEKDFTCLEDRGEDESNNYPNPKALTY